MNTMVSLPITAAVSVTSPALAAFDSDSVAAQTARLEKAIDLLRTRHVCEGWQLDEERASRALRYFRAGCPDDEDQTEWAATLYFIASHGISIDWLGTGDVTSMICGAASRSERALASGSTSQRVKGDGRLWSFYDKFERAYNRMKALDTPESMAGSGPQPTPEEKIAFKKWERAGNAAFKAARRVLVEPALTGDGLLMKIHVAGFEFDAKPDTFSMPYRGLETPQWTAGRFSEDAAVFVGVIGEDLRRAKLSLS